MVSSLFRKDYNILTAEGVRFTPDDIIRLNALALKVKLAAKPFIDLHLPRVLFMPGFTLREPTIGHEIWLERVAEYFDMGDNRVFRFVYAFALSRDAADLPNALIPRRVIRKVFAFARRRLLGITNDMLADAIDFILFGADWTAGVLNPTKTGKPSSPAPLASETDSPVLGVLVGATARRLPVTLEGARKMTAAQLLAATLLADIRDREYAADTEKNNALGNYIRAIEEVRNRKPQS